MTIEKFPKEPIHHGWVVVQQPLMMPKDEIVKASRMVFDSHDPSYPDQIIVRVEKIHPTIEFVCANEQEAEELCKWFNDSRKVVPFKKNQKEQ